MGLAHSIIYYMGSMRAGMFSIHNCHINNMYSTLDCIKGCYMMYVDHS